MNNKGLEEPNMTGYTMFLRHLGYLPEPDSVALSLAQGPLATFSPMSVDLWITGENFDILRIGSCGVIDDPAQIYDRISLSFRTPITVAFATGTPVIVPVNSLFETYPEFEVDREFWLEIVEQHRDGDLVQVPFHFSGVVIGAFTFLTSSPTQWDANHFMHFDAIGAALALWASHPRNGAVNGARKRSNNVGIGLTQRQIDILLLIRDGKSNGAISARLGFSTSTIKQELQRIMRRLNVHDRSQAVAVATDLQLLASPQDL